MAMLNIIHKKFIEMLLRKNRNWIVEYDYLFRIVKAKKSGIFRRIIAYRSTSITQTLDSSYNCYYKAQFIDKEAFIANYEKHNTYVTTTTGIERINPICFDNYINVNKSQIYIIPDIPFNGDNNFETLYRYQRNGRIEKVA